MSKTESPSATPLPIAEYSAVGSVTMLCDEKGQVEIVSLTKEMLDYLEHEAGERGVSKLAVYREEMAAKAALDAVGGDEEFLARAEARSRWPDKIDDQPKPF